MFSLTRVENFIAHDASGIGVRGNYSNTGKKIRQTIKAALSHLKKRNESKL